MRARCLFGDNFGVADKFAVMSARADIFHDAVFDVVEIPERSQSRFVAGQGLKHRLIYLFLSALNFPDADFVNAAFEIRRGIICGDSLAQVKPVAVFQSGEAAGVISGAGKGAIEVNFHPARA